MSARAPWALIEQMARREAERATPRWFTGTVTALNDDGSYQVLCNELNVIYPRVFRSAPDRSRLLLNERVTIRARGVVWEIV